MIGRLKAALHGVSAFFARRRERRPESSEKEVIQGSAGNVIIVKSPNTEYFKEAIFILRDDLFARRGVDSRQLLRQAREAAREYVSDRVPSRELTVLQHILFYLFGAASVLLVLILLQVL